MSPVPVAALISGRGSNLAALIAAQRPQGPYAIRVVVSNVAGAPGLEHARAAEIETIEVPHGPFGRDREAHERAIDDVLGRRDVSLIALAGYMRVLTPWLVARWRGRMLNIHPSLLPAFPGLDTHERALAAGVRVHGCTVHYVNEGVDEGAILGQAAVPVRPGDDAARLAARVLAAEHALYPACLALAAGGRATLEANPEALFSLFPPTPIS